MVAGVGLVCADTRQRCVDLMSEESVWKQHARCDCVKVRKVFESIRQEVDVWALGGVWSCTGEIAQSYQLRHMRVQRREDVQRNDTCVNGDGGEVTGVVTSGRKLSRRGRRRAQDSTGVEECKSWRSEKGLSQEQHGGGTGQGSTLMP